MTMYFSDEACRRAGLSHDDLLRLSGDDSNDSSTDAVVQAWRDNLRPSTPPPVLYTAVEIKRITERNPSLFRAKPSS